jgi:hypothetical protein
MHFLCRAVGTGKQFFAFAFPTSENDIKDEQENQTRF